MREGGATSALAITNSVSTNVNKFKIPNVVFDTCSIHDSPLKPLELKPLRVIGGGCVPIVLQPVRVILSRTMY